MAADTYLVGPDGRARRVDHSLARGLWRACSVKRTEGGVVLTQVGQFLERTDAERHASDDAALVGPDGAVSMPKAGAKPAKG